MGSLSGEDASAGMTTTGLMCSDSAEARRKLGGFWGERTARKCEPCPAQSYGHSGPGSWAPCPVKKIPSSFLPALLPEGGILEPSPKDMARKQLHPTVTDSWRMQG